MTVASMFYTNTPTVKEFDNRFDEFKNFKYEVVCENKQKQVVNFEKLSVTYSSEAFEKTIAFIKKHEGFAGGKAYYCCAGYKTIGYGHVIKPNEHFENDKITKKEADRLLRHDFSHSVALARKHTNNLNENQLMAVAHFIFAKGIGNYLKSELKHKIDNGENPDEEFKKWCKYHKPNGQVVTSNYSLNIRKWEVEMFNTE